MYDELSLSCAYRIDEAAASAINGYFSCLHTSAMNGGGVKAHKKWL